MSKAAAYAAFDRTSQFRPFNLDRRDWLMLAVGAFGALVAVIGAVLLGRALKSEPPRPE